jgi:hypothetical protein
MIIVMVALTPATLFGFWLYGWPAIYLWMITVGAAMPGRSLLPAPDGPQGRGRCCWTDRRC